MKKLLSIAAVLLICMGSQAQIVSSRSSLVRTEKQPSKTQWFVRAGMNIMDMTGDDVTEYVKSNIGYNAVFGFARSMGTAGAYWGMDFGLTSRGFKIEYDGESAKGIAHAVQVSPFTFGWRINVADQIAIDPHIGAFVSCDYTSKLSEDNGDKYDWDEAFEDYDCFDAGLNVGLSIWYNRFNIDFSYQSGFIEVFPGDDVKSSNFMIRLGIAF